jgi:Fe-S oxidoreductase
MKIEFLHHWHARHGTSARSRLTAFLPRYARAASRMAPLLNLRNSSRALAAIAEKLIGMSARRTLPPWRRDIWRPRPPKQGGREVLLFVDCFSRYFEPENARATRNVLEACGYSVLEDDSKRPLCCGRTFLSAGLVEEAREELTRLVGALGARAASGVPIVGIEPSCLLTLRDELGVVVKEGPVQAVGRQAVLLEELLVAAARKGELKPPFRMDGGRAALLHGHCHQKALGAMPDVLAALQLIPGLSAQVIDSSCCGMAGSFGYEAEHYDASLRMAERSLLPAVRAAAPEALIVADGTSCRHQIADGTGRSAIHVARVLESALPS